MDKTSEYHMPEGLSVAEQAEWWVAHLDCNPDDEEARHSFRQWLMDRPDHAGAYEAARFLWTELDMVAKSLPREEEDAFISAAMPIPDAKRKYRFTKPLVLFAAVAVLFTGLLQGPRLYENSQADFTTADGSRQTEALADGSRIFLNSDTAIRLEFSEDERRLTLLRGEAYFAVAPDPERPFIVETATGEARALGTEYTVRYRDGAMETYVAEGTVSVYNIHAPEPEQTVLKAQQAVLITESGDLRRRRQPAASLYLGWRENRLSVRNISLAQLIKRLDHQYPGTILLLEADREIGNISGTFITDNVPEVLNSLSKSLKIEIISLPGGLKILKS